MKKNFINCLVVCACLAGVACVVFLYTQRVTVQEVSDASAEVAIDAGMDTGSAYLDAGQKASEEVSDELFMETCTDI
jgi:hypothetical protein